MAESDPRISIAPGQFDRDPWLLNLSNGTVELRSFRFREHRSHELLTKLAGAKYSSKAKCPLWKKFLREVFVHNLELIPFIQRSIGYTLTGVTREECIFVLVGSGRNGKSTMIGILNHLLGDYAGVAEMEAFLVSHGNSLREDIADMRGRRLISAQEPSMKSAFAEATIKWISGGDKLRARRLYEHAQEFQPSHKLWLAMNCLPKISYNDKATWSRLQVIPFNACFEGRTNRDLKAEMLGELNGILKWALEGCAQWQQHGLNAPACVKAATRRWRTDAKSAA